MRVMYVSYNGVTEPLFQSQVIPYLEGLAKKGCLKFTLLSFEKQKGFTKIADIDAIKQRFKENHIEWYSLTYHKYPLIISSIYDIIVGFFYGAFLIFKKRINIIHARSYLPATIALFLNKCFKIKFIFDMRGMMIDEYVDAFFLKKDSMLYKFSKTLEKKILISANTVIVLTEKIKNIIENFDYLENRRDLRIEVIPCCIDLDKFKYTIEKNTIREDLSLKDKFIFIYTGSVGTWYFLEGMLDFFRVAKKYIPAAHFLLLSQSDKDFIKKTILSRNLNLNDFTIDDSPHNRIAEYISQSDAGIVFYKQTFSRLACCPVKFSEYLACGIPVILNSGIGDTEEIVRGRQIGAVVNDFSLKSYEEAVKKILEIKKEGVSLRERCRKTAKEFFSLEYGIEKYRGVYQDIR